MGKAIVTTECTGMDELLGDSECGLITDNSINGIFKGIKSQLDNPQRKIYFSKQAVNRSKGVKSGYTVSVIEDFFNCLIVYKHET